MKSDANRSPLRMTAQLVTAVVAVASEASSVAGKLRRGTTVAATRVGEKRLLQLPVGPPPALTPPASPPPAWTPIGTPPPAGPPPTPMVTLEPPPPPPVPVVILTPATYPPPPTPVVVLTPATDPPPPTPVVVLTPATDPPPPPSPVVALPPANQPPLPTLSTPTPPPVAPSPANPTPAMTPTAAPPPPAPRVTLPGNLQPATNKNAPGVDAAVAQQKTAQGGSLLQPIFGFAPESCYYNPYLPANFSLTFADHSTSIAQLTYQQASSGTPVYGPSNRPEWADVQQTGQIGDCWFLAGLAAIPASGYMNILKNHLQLADSKAIPSCNTITLGGTQFSTASTFPEMVYSYHGGGLLTFPFGASQDHVMWVSYFERAMAAYMDSSEGPGQRAGYAGISGNRADYGLTAASGVQAGHTEQIQGAWANNIVSTVLSTSGVPAVFSTPNAVDLAGLSNGQFSQATNVITWDPHTSLQYIGGDTATLVYTSLAYNQTFAADHSYTLIRNDLPAGVPPTTATSATLRNPWGSQYAGSGGDGSGGLIAVPIDVLSRVFVTVDYIDNPHTLHFVDSAISG